MLSSFVENLRRANRLVVGGMFYFDSPGHMLSESDLLVRLIRLDPAIKARSPIVLLPPTPMAKMIADLLRAHSIQVVLEPHAIPILREIQLFHPDLILDVGQAHWKLVRPDNSPRKCGDLYPLSFAWALRSDEFIGQAIRVHQVWNGMPGFLPLREALGSVSFDPELVAMLGSRKYAVLQIKSQLINGTIRLLTNEHYEPVLQMLKDSGYALIMGGREPMLEVFKRYEVFDYPRSKFVSPKNDFLLFSQAALAITTPSGAGLFCDTLGVSCCQLGTWTLLPHPSVRTVAVPSRLVERKSRRTLKFAEQVSAFARAYHEVTGPMFFDSATYEDLPPTPEEIRRATAETLQVREAQSAQSVLQMKRLKELDPVGIWKVAASRISSVFLDAHPEFLG